MKTRFLLFVSLAISVSLTACAPQTREASSSVKPPTPSTSTLITFRGRCDGSAVAWISGSNLVTASDETDDATAENTLAVYDAHKGGLALTTVAMNDALGLPQKGKRSAKEVDIEAATRLGDRVFWIGSHSLSKSGEERPARYNFFATTGDAKGMTLSGKPYHNLKVDMLADPRLAPLLTNAAAKEPEDKGGWNIEGITATPERTLLIGFRNPIVNGKALLIPLLNPNAVIAGTAKAKFGAPVLLDVSEGKAQLGESRGIRDITWWAERKCYVVLTGSYLPGSDPKTPFALFLWDGKSKPVRVAADLTLLHAPEGVMTVPGDKLQVLVLSDDGSLNACKEKSDPDRTFTGQWLTVP